MDGMEMSRVKPLPSVRLARGTRLLSKKRFLFYIIMYWVYTLTWLGALFWLSYLCAAGILVKAVLLLVLAIGCPSVGELFGTYAKYKTLWEESQKPFPTTSAGKTEEEHS